MSRSSTPKTGRALSLDACDRVQVSHPIHTPFPGATKPSLIFPKDDFGNQLLKSFTIVPFPFRCAGVASSILFYCASTRTHKNQVFQGSTWLALLLSILLTYRRQLSLLHFESDYEERHPTKASVTQSSSS